MKNNWDSGKYLSTWIFSTAFSNIEKLEATEVNEQWAMDSILNHGTSFRGDLMRMFKVILWKSTVDPQKNVPYVIIECGGREVYKTVCFKKKTYRHNLDGQRLEVIVVKWLDVEHQVSVRIRGKRLF